MLCFLLLIFISTLQAKTIEGVATSLNENKVVYKEILEITPDKDGLNLKIETKYYKPDNQKFAEMTSDFTKNRFVPEVTFVDRRFNESEFTKLDLDKNLIEFESNGKKKTFSISKDKVVGQGFDNFIKTHFQLLKKQDVALSFGALPEMDFYSFKGYTKKVLPENRIQFAIDLSNIFLKIFSNEILLEYDLENKQIKGYSGISNILTDQGQKQSVIIKYREISGDKEK